jgi:hypothetical protein
MPQPPSRVLTMGLHGSASTWVFNVARELLATRFGDAAVHPCHASGRHDLHDELARGDRHIVAKTHGWPGLAGFAQEIGAHLIVSVRDPRDAVLSQMQRFGDSFDRSVRAIGRDCLAAVECANAGFPVLRYEDRYFEAPATVGVIADYLGLAVEQADSGQIFERYTTDAVRTFAASVAALPPERIAGSGGFRYDLLTQITNSHIGDGRQGKWRDQLDAAQRTISAMVFRPFLARFGYTA